jgi:hypothetical protein
MDDLPSKGRIAQSQRVASRVSLLTIHDNPHIMNKAIDDLKNLRYGDSTLIQGKSIQPFQHHLIIIPSKELLYKCPCIALSQINISGEALTWLSLLDEFGRKPEDGKQLHEGLHEGLRHSGCVRDLGTNVEMLQKGFNRLE